jgi:hypothetical protein
MSLVDYCFYGRVSFTHPVCIAPILIDKSIGRALLTAAFACYVLSMFLSVALALRVLYDWIYRKRQSIDYFYSTCRLYPATKCCLALFFLIGSDSGNLR